MARSGGIWEFSLDFLESLLGEPQATRHNWGAESPFIPKCCPMTGGMLPPWPGFLQNFLIVWVQYPSPHPRLFSLSPLPILLPLLSFCLLHFWLWHLSSLTRAWGNYSLPISLPSAIWPLDVSCKWPANKKVLICLVKAGLSGLLFAKLTYTVHSRSSKCLSSGIYSRRSHLPRAATLLTPSCQCKRWEKVFIWFGRKCIIPSRPMCLFSLEPQT